MAAGPSPGEEAKKRAQSDEELDHRRREAEVKGEETKVAQLEADVEKLVEGLQTARENRRLRQPIAIAALVAMLAQVALSDAIFVWYGDTNGWNISAAAISVWMGTNVVEVVAVVLVIVNYLFPNGRQKDA